MATRSPSHGSASPVTASSRSHLADLNNHGKRYRDPATPSISVNKVNPIRDSKRKLFDQFLDRFQANRELPLNLILFITSWLDDVGDLARICRTSKLLYYMTLPRLWEHVTLRSYNEIRYRGGSPEGVGGGSPFSTALESLVSRNMGTYVKSLRLVGNWKENGEDEFAKGRVPDSSMMLNIVVRAALDNCPNLQSFSWELDAKPTKAVYLGLAARKTLTHLTLKMSASRIPKPAILIPAIPSLKSLSVLDMDPLCYPDDISMLIGGATNLKELKLHWSPRMRKERELSTNMETYFKHIGPRRLGIKRLSLSNSYARVTPEAGFWFFEQLEQVTFLNCINPHDPASAYVDASWKSGPKIWDGLPYLKSIRTDIQDPIGLAFVAHKTGLEEIYMITPAARGAPTASQANTPAPVSASPAASTPPAFATTRSTSQTPGTPATAPTPQCHPQTVNSLIENVSIASDYLAAITTNHGPTLKRLLLNAQWNIGTAVLDHLIESCPNLQQLGLALDTPRPFEHVRSIASQLHKLYAIRVLIPGDNYETVVEEMQDLGIEAEAGFLDILSLEVVKEEYKGIRWFGLGSKAFEFLGVYVDEETGKERRRVRSLTWEQACKEVEIFRLDSFDI